MKLKHLTILLIISAAFFLTNCAAGPVKGSLFTSTTFEGAANPAATVNGAGKVGEGCIHSVLGVVNWGDASIGSASMSAGIQQISTVDHTSLGILFLYRNYCTIVRGS